jgi:hypothetical protein
MRLQQCTQEPASGVLATANLNRDAYGYWIRDDGTFVSVRCQQHQIVLNEIFPTPDDYTGRFQDSHAYECGWIKVSHSHGQYAIHMERPPLAALRGLLEYVAVADEEADYHLYHDFGEPRKRTTAYYNYYFFDGRDAVQRAIETLITRVRRERLYHEASRAFRE